MSLLKEVKYVLFSIKLCLLYLLGRSVFFAAPQRGTVLLTGEMNYSGGTFVYFSGLLRLLSGRGFRLTVLVCRDDCRQELRRLAEEQRARLVVLPATFEFLKYLLLLWNTIRFRPSCAISSSSGPGLHTMSLLLGLPTIHIFHSSPDPTISRRERRLVKWFFKTPHQMIAVSRSNREALIRSFRLSQHQAEMVHLVYNGVSELTRTAPETGPRGQEVATIGHVVTYKNPQVWFETAQYVQERTTARTLFTWVGDGPDVAEYRRKARQHPDIRFIGYSDDIEQILQRTRIYYQPSRAESFGLAVAQAMSLGIPCVVSDQGALPELVVNGRSGFVCPCDDIRSQGEAIIRLLEDAELWKSMSREARRLFEQKFRSSLWEKNMLDVIMPQLGLG